MQRLPTVADKTPKPGNHWAPEINSEVFNASLTCVSKKDPYLELERISGAAEVGQAKCCKMMFAQLMRTDPGNSQHQFLTRFAYYQAETRNKVYIIS